MQRVVIYTEKQSTGFCAFISVLENVLTQMSQFLRIILRWAHYSGRTEQRGRVNVLTIAFAEGCFNMCFVLDQLSINASRSRRRRSGSGRGDSSTGSRMNICKSTLFRYKKQLIN
jgi:hypothetical protein